MKMKAVLILILLLSAGSTFAQENTPPSSDDIMKEAMMKASAENKAVFLMFHASWCGWCKKMDASMNDDTTKDFFDKNFVVAHMVVKESKDKKHLENPGAEEFLAKYKGDKSGIPFWLIFDNKGNLMADSFIRPEGVGMDQPGANIGCPAQDDEVAQFISKLKTTTSITREEEAAITARFKQNSSR
jgi:thiol-disulfide isomerase/thioredoxin